MVNRGKTIAIIQARMTSTRLPGKVLMTVLGKTILEYVVERVSRARSVDQVVVATTTNPEDDAIVELLRRTGTACYRGSETDVLDRYYQAARQFGAGDVIRITSDCPLIDPDIIDEVVGDYRRAGADYGCNVLKRTFPDGLDVEIFSCSTLKRTWEEAEWASEHEHVSTYIRKHPEIFRLTGIRHSRDLSAMRWTLDHEEDFRLIERIIMELYPRDPRFGMTDILEFLAGQPELSELNRHIPAAEGYAKSLREDKKVARHCERRP